MPDTASPKPGRRRLPRGEREQMILRGAIEFFAEVGFEGDTRELARRLGITQPLIFQYFPSKDDLIERVYQEVYLSRWNPWWEELLADRSRPLKERLVTFYTDYTETILTYQWVRIFMFSGLRGVNINKRYLSLVKERLLKPIVVELRHELGLPPPSERALTEAEMELAWGLHGGFFYVGVRKWIYGLPTPDDLGRLVDVRVTSFLDGADKVVRDQVARPASESYSIT